MKTETIEALIKVQTKIAAFAKNEANPFFKSKYVPLPDILKQVKPVLNENGFLLTQRPSISENGQEVLISELIHTSGESISCIAPLKMDEKDKNNPQKYGSAITYMRRYSLTSLLGIEETDDDGEAAKPDGKADKKNGDKRNNFGLSSDGELANGADLKETQTKAANQFFSKIKKDIEDCGSLAEMDALIEKNKEKLNKLQKYHVELYEMLIEAVDVMKLNFIAE